MLTVGVDFATEPEKTAMATVEWSGGRAVVQSLTLAVEDAAICAQVTGAAKLGLDCPLGWPDEFVDFLRQHHDGHVLAPEQVAGKEWRRRLAYRETDRRVQETTGLWPLSVSADRIGMTAMRAAGLLARLDAEGQRVDRTGAGVVVEVYPAASLHHWGLPHTGYKGPDKREQLGALLARLRAEATWLDLAGHDVLCAGSDDAFDAVVAALTARASALGKATTPLDKHREQAGREGWIALPTVPLAGLPG